MKHVSRLELITLSCIGFTIFLYANSVFKKSDPEITVEKISDNQYTDVLKKTQHSQQGGAEAFPATAIIEKDNFGKCDQNCISILDKLSSGEALTSQEISYILKTPRNFALALKDKPQDLARLIATLQDDETGEISEQHAAYAVLQSLSIDEKTETAISIVSAQSPEERMVGLKLLQDGIASHDDAVDAFASVIESETDPRVLAVAINMARTVTGERNAQLTRDALSSVIRSRQSAYASGEALLAKIALSPSPTIVRQDVYNLMSSHAADRQSYGIRAFEEAMDRYYVEFESTGGWREDPMLQELITSIARDTHADLENRNKAQEILDNYY